MENLSDLDVVDSGPGLPPSPRTRNPDEAIQDGLNERDPPVPGAFPAGRDPTFKEFGEQLRALTLENFQLKVRIHLHESKCKKTCSDSGKDAAATSAATAELATEFRNLRQGIDTYKRKLQESENRNKEFQTRCENFAERENLLLTRNNDLTERLNELDRELALSRLNQRTESEDIGKCFDGFKLDTDKEEFGFAFPQSSVQLTDDQQVHELSLVNQDLCQQIEELTIQNEDLRFEVEGLRRELEALYQQTNEFQTENQELNQKYSSASIDNEALSREVNSLNTEIQRSKEILTHIEDRERENRELLMEKDASLEKLRKTKTQLVESLKEMGFQHLNNQEKIAALEKQVEELQLQTNQQVESMGRLTQLESDAKTKARQLTEKLDSVKKITDLFQSRVTEMIGFLEGLLELESRGLPVLDRVLRDHRETIDTSLKQSQMLSQVLGQLLSDEVPMVDLQLIELSAFNIATLASIQLSTSMFEAQSPRSRSRPTSTNVSIQCDRTNECPVSRGAEIRNNLLARENLRLEGIKDRLMQEKGALYAQVATLEANMNALREQGLPVVIDELKYKVEKRENQLRTLEGVLRNRDLRLAEILSERNDLLSKLEMAEITLRTLHDDHAKLVTELSGIKSKYPLNENYDHLIRKAKSDEALRQEDSSPDLGIESGHDAPPSENVLKVSNNGKMYNVDELRMINRELAAKLRHTKSTLDKTMEKLVKTTKEKEQVQKAVCRQLHKTHQILRTAKKNLESPCSSEPDLAELQLQGDYDPQQL